MRPWSLGLLVLAGCGASEVQSQHLKDGSWKFTCELAMDECIQRVQSTCPHERFRILEATSETRLRDAPPFERAYHTSRVHLACSDDGQNVLLKVGEDAPLATPAGSAAPAHCTKGETRACVGSAGCKGGQACLPDGSGFGSCDCGPAPAPAPAPADSTSSPPPGAPADETTSSPVAPAPSSGAAPAASGAAPGGSGVGGSAPRPAPR